MQKKKIKNQAASLASVSPFATCYVFRLYVSSMRPSSARAIVNTRRICDKYLPDAYELEIIDILQHPAQTIQAQIIAAPTLIKLLPLPEQRFIGDLSQTERFLSVLGLRAY